jgi:hypothetical protein
MTVASARNEEEMRRNHQVVVETRDGIGWGVGPLVITIGTWQGDLDEL